MQIRLCFVAKAVKFATAAAAKQQLYCILPRHRRERQSDSSSSIFEHSYIHTPKRSTAAFKTLADAFPAYAPMALLHINVSGTETAAHERLNKPYLKQDETRLQSSVVSPHESRRVVIIAGLTTSFAFPPFFQGVVVTRFYFLPAAAASAASGLLPLHARLNFEKCCAAEG